jgi:hypothetical protein
MAVRRLLVALAVASLVGGCSSDGTPSACKAPKLVPTHLPAGVHRITAKPLAGGEWTQTWKSRTVTVQVIGQVNANLGDEVKSAIVRGHPASYGQTGIADGPLAVEWTEPGPCKTDKDYQANYAVIVRGISGSEMLKIANSLRG